TLRELFFLLTRECASQLSSHALCNGILYGENVGELLFEFISPKLPPVRDVHQPHRFSDPLARFLHAPVKLSVHSLLATCCAGVLLRNSIAAHSADWAHYELFQAAEPCD